MRLFLLPVSTRRTLIFCERIAQTPAPGEKPPISERVVSFANKTWTGWEKAEKGWQKKVTGWGNHLFRQIPFEEWGLKTIPPATQTRLREFDSAKAKIECLFPSAYLNGVRVPEVLRAIATERQSLHKGKIWQSVGLMPITAPVALIPVIPNLPFLYLCFRAYSHYSALYGGRLLEHLLKNDMVRTTPSAQLDTIYTAGLLHKTRQQSRDAPSPTEEDIARVSNTVEQQMKEGQEEVMVLQKWNGKLLAEAFKLPEMEVEIERAVEQVEKSLEEKKRKKSAVQGQLQEGKTEQEQDPSGHEKKQ